MKIIKHIQYIFSTGLLFFVCFYSTTVKAQSRFGKNDTIIVEAYITTDGDTIATAMLTPVYTTGILRGKWKKKYADWTRLRNAVYVTYPYSITASAVMNDINSKLVGVTDKGKRKAIIQSREKELKSQFADKLKDLSVYQGKVLMKLIYRQTGNNCYEIIEDYKGKFDVKFWQTIAVIFGSNLKQSYDPTGKDEVMEMIVVDVEKMYGVRGTR